MNTDQTQEETMKMTQKKRERENTPNNDDIIEIEKPSKKFCSEETKKLRRGRRRRETHWDKINI